MFSSALSETLASSDLLRNLVLRELRSSYKGSVLGFLWSLLNPLFTMVIFTVVFGHFLQVPLPADESGGRSFPAFLLVGLLPWNLINSAMSAGCLSFVNNGNLIRRVYFARALLPASTVLASAFHFLIGLGLLLILLAFLGVDYWSHLWLLPVPVLALLLLALGLAFVAAVANVYFRDTQHLISLFAMAWFYLSPVVYPVELVEPFGEPWTTLYRLNPAAALVGSFRAILYHGRAPDVWDLCWALVSSAAVFLAGWALFQRADPRLAEEI
jgi:homopolymeric O-antigen transport system permease protein